LAGNVDGFVKIDLRLLFLPARDLGLERNED
jgi:hypothetical protein